MYVCDWVTLLNSRKLTEHHKPTKKEKIKIIKNCILISAIFWYLLKFCALDKYLTCFLLVPVLCSVSGGQWGSYGFLFLLILITTYSYLNILWLVDSINRNN